MMATNQGTDLRALLDLHDPEQYTSGPENVAHSKMRSVFEEENTNATYGDPLGNDTIDIRKWMGARPSASQIATITDTVVDVLEEPDDRVADVTAVAELVGTKLRVGVEVATNNQTAELVRDIDTVTGAVLIPEDV